MSNLTLQPDRGSEDEEDDDPACVQPLRQVPAPSMEGDDRVLRTGMRLVGSFRSENTTNMLLKKVKEEMGQLESLYAEMEV